MARERERSVVLQDFHNEMPKDRRPSALSVVSVVSFSTPSWPPAEHLLPPVPALPVDLQPTGSAQPPLPAQSLFSANYSLSQQQSPNTPTSASHLIPKSDALDRTPTQAAYDDDVAGAIAALPAAARRKTVPDAGATELQSDLENGSGEDASQDTVDERPRAKSLASCAYSFLAHFQCTFVPD